MNKKVVIIGSGMAGYMLAIELRALSSEVGITLVTESDGRYYPKPLLSSALHHKKSPAMLTTAQAEEMAEKYNLTVHTHTKITAIDQAQSCVLTGNATAIPFDKLVLATGSMPRPLPLPQGGGEQAHQVNTIEQYESWLQALNKPGKVAIIGSGLVGVEFAHDLVTAGYEVVMFSQTSHALAELVPESVGGRVTEHLCNLGVQWQTDPVQTLEENGTIIKTKAQTWRVMASLAAVGIQAETELAEKAGLEVAQAIVVDQYLQTSANNIYAIGDCAAAQGLHLTYVAPIKQQVKALAQTLLGSACKVEYPAMPVVVKMPTLPLTLVPLRGLAEGQWQTEESQTNSAVEVFYDANRQVQAFVLAGEAIKQRNTWLQKMPKLLAS